MERGRVIVVGGDPLAREVERALTAGGRVAHRVHRPSTRELRRRLTDDVDAVVIVDRDDVTALRAALLTEYVRPGVRLIVTIFDRTVAEQMRRAIPDCHVLSLADAVRGAIVGPCLGPFLAAGRDGDGLVIVRSADGDGDPIVERLPRPEPGRWRRTCRRLRSQLRPHDRPSRLLLCSLALLAGLVLVEAALVGIAHHEPLGIALYSAVKATTTVGPSPAVDHDPGWLQTYSTLAMGAALAGVAVFTAALTTRLLSRRLTAIVGRRTVPRSDHVVVVGLGQVGLRACLELRALGVPVVAVERDRDSRHLGIAKRRGIPVVLGDGGDRSVLEALSLDRARALAAVSSDELTNIAVSVAALAVEPSLRTVLRAGGNEITRETQALFPIGVARDVQRIGAAALAAAALDLDVRHAFDDDGAVRLLHADGTVGALGEEAPANPAGTCGPTSPPPGR